MKSLSIIALAWLGLLAAAPCWPADASDGAVYRCIARGRVLYQDAPCPTGAREIVVYIAANSSGPAPVGPTVASTAATVPKPAGDVPNFREALSRIRVGMTGQDLETLDPRLRNGRSRMLEVNGHRHEWRYVADDCVVHLADGVVVAVYR